ncbi:amine oxidase, partial [bacterium]
TVSVSSLYDGSRLSDLHLHRLPAPFALVPSMLRMRGVGLRAKWSNRRASLLAMRLGPPDVDQLDGLAGDVLLHRLGVAPAFVDWFWRSLSLTILNVPLERVSGGALMRCFAQLIGHDDWCFGMPKAGLGDLFAPAARERLDSWGALRLHTRVQTLLARDGACTGVELDDGSHIEARHVVCALPPAETAAVQPSAWSRDPWVRDARTFEASEYVSVYQWFDRRVTDRSFWTRTWSRTDLTSDYYDLTTLRGLPPERGSLIATNLIHTQRLPPLDDEQILDRTFAELAEVAPEAMAARRVHARIHRIPLAIPCPTPGSERRRPACASPVPGLLLAGDWTRTDLPASMESAVRSGFLAAEELLRREGRPRTIARPPPRTSGLAGVLRRRHARQCGLRRSTLATWSL